MISVFEGPEVHPNAADYLKKQQEEPILSTWCQETELRREERKDRNSSGSDDYFRGLLKKAGVDGASLPRRVA